MNLLSVISGAVKTKRYRLRMPDEPRRQLTIVCWRCGSFRCCNDSMDQLIKVLRDFLTGSGYREKLTVETALAELARRYQVECPHELGVFLGIPLPDVLGFIKFKGKKAVAAGYWKVYHDVGGKLALFARYQEAKRNFIDFVTDGNSPGAYLRRAVLLLSREGGRDDGDCYFWRGPLLGERFRPSV